MLTFGYNQNITTMIEIKGEYWYTQMEAAEFLGLSWKSVASLKRRIGGIRVTQIGKQNYYEYESIARFNQERQKPSKRRDLSLWRHPELKNREYIPDENLERDYYSTKEARGLLELDGRYYGPFYTTMANHGIAPFRSGRRCFWPKEEIDVLKERLDASTMLTVQYVNGLRLKVANLSRKEEALTKENITLQYKLDVSEKERQAYEVKYIKYKDIEKTKNDEISRLNCRLSFLMKFSYEFLEMAFAFTGFRLNPWEKNVLRLYFKGMTFDEIARRKGSDTDTVRNIFYRALEKTEIYIRRITFSKDTLSLLQGAIERN